MSYDRECYRAWSKARRAAGECTKCRAPATSSLCEACNIAAVSRRREIRRARRASGLCAACGVPSTSYMCGPCNDRHVSYARDSRERRTPRIDLIRLRAGRMFSIRPKSVIREGADINGGNEYDFLRDVAITRASNPSVVSVGERPSRDYHCGKRTPVLRPFAVRFIGDRIVHDDVVGAARVVTFEITDERPPITSRPGPAIMSDIDRARTLAILGHEGTLESSL